MEGLSREPGREVGDMEVDRKEVNPQKDRERKTREEKKALKERNRLMKESYKQVAKNLEGFGQVTFDCLQTDLRFTARHPSH